MTCHAMLIEVRRQASDTGNKGKNTMTTHTSANGNIYTMTRLSDKGCMGLYSVTSQGHTYWVDHIGGSYWKWTISAVGGATRVRGFNTRAEAIAYLTDVYIPALVSETVQTELSNLPTSEVLTGEHDHNRYGVQIIKFGYDDRLELYPSGYVYLTIDGRVYQLIEGFSTNPIYRDFKGVTHEQILAIIRAFVPNFGVEPELEPESEVQTENPELLPLDTAVTLAFETAYQGKDVRLAFSHFDGCTPLFRVYQRLDVVYFGSSVFCMSAGIVMKGATEVKWERDYNSWVKLYK